nr:E3 SUMO-protein ligase ZBED1-like isoform X2 [Misgurnus anguillicaudatus]
MLRHYRAKHEQSGGSMENSSSQVNRKQQLDEALVDMIVEDSQPFSIVDDSGFKAFVAKLDPTYALPSRQALKVMVDHKYEEQKQKAMAELQKTEGVSLTADMWTSINMDAYLAVTCHYVDDKDNLATVLLGVRSFPKAHTAENLAEAKRLLFEEWGIQSKIKSLVTDAASNMIAIANNLKIRHVICIAHALNLVVKKSLDATPGLEDIRTRARRMVTYFKTSTTAKERLREKQEQMARPVKKLILEVDTRWNSTYLMLQRIYEEREPVGAALATLRTDVAPLTSEEYFAISECMKVLAPFQVATVELSEEKRVSGSKVIPMMKMLRYTINETLKTISNDTAMQLGQNLSRRLADKFSALESTSVLTLATLLDPRFKTFGFHNHIQAQTAIGRLTSECTALIRDTAHQTSSHSAQPDTAQNLESTDQLNLWELLDNDASNARRNKSATSDATIEVQRYMTDPPLQRSADPLAYWSTHKAIYPHLYQLSKLFLCTPASSVPCERIFSKAGEIVSKKRNRLSPKTVEKIIFLNKNHNI